MGVNTDESPIRGTLIFQSQPATFVSDRGMLCRDIIILDRQVGFRGCANQNRFSIAKFNNSPFGRTAAYHNTVFVGYRGNRNRNGNFRIQRVKMLKIKFRNIRNRRGINVRMGLIQLLFRLGDLESQVFASAVFTDAFFCC
jgi:hypothetical protein